MPFDKNKCVKINGKMYFWDNKTKKIKEHTVKEYDVKNCPADVLCALLTLLDGKEDGENAGA